jgi:hypothetical protein
VNQMPKPNYNTTNTVYTVTTPSTATGTYATAEWGQLADMRDIARTNVRDVLDREFPPELREFLIWLVNNDAHINAKFMAFRACKRIGVEIK